MTVKRAGLGRNLSALLGNTPPLVVEKPTTEQFKISVNCLQPGEYQPRKDMEEAPLQELAASIQQQGLLQPILVREVSPDRYEIIAGERRWRACQLAGLTEVPVIIRQVDNETAMAMALVENLQREDLNAMDQARAMHRLTTEFALTHQQVADLLGKSRAAVSNFLRLLSLNTAVTTLLEHGDLDMGHARALLMLDDSLQPQVAQIIVAKHLSVRETEKLVARIKEGRPSESSTLPINPIVQAQVNALASHLNTKVKIKSHKTGKGTLVIHYDSLQELQSVVERIETGCRRNENAEELAY